MLLRQYRDYWKLRVAIALIGLMMSTSAPAQGTTTRVSVATGGIQANGQSDEACISDDGRYVVFQSLATNLAGAETNFFLDIFLHDRESGITTRVNEASAGGDADNNSHTPNISSDGSGIVFTSWATNLVSGHLGPYSDIFFHDRQSAVTTLASITSDGFQGGNDSGIGLRAGRATLSSDARYVAFASSARLDPLDLNGAADIFVRDRQAGTTALVSVASDGTQSISGGSYPMISGNGRYVAFVSASTNLVVDDTNGATDVFVHDRQTGTTTRISVATDGTQANGHSTWPALSFDGRYVAFQSEASNLVPSDTNNVADVFFHDRDSGVTTRVSVASDGSQGDSGSLITADGSAAPTLSGDGRYIAFMSDAFNLVPGDTNNTDDVFVHDRLSGITYRASVSSSGVESNGGGVYPCISADGGSVAFTSSANNLVANDTNGTLDVFVHTQAPGPVVAAVLPASRSVQVGDTATAFATIINAGTTSATDCGIVPLTSVQADFSYQTTDASNALIGTPNTPVDIAAGGSQSYVFAFTPTASFSPVDAQLTFDCIDTDPAPVTVGLNTLLLVADSSPVPDIVALGATLTGDGIVNLSSTGVFAVASVNVGIAGTITVSADTGGASIPISVAACESDPGTGVCINPTTPTTGPVTTSIAADATPTFSFFVTGTGTVPFDPATNRIFVRFKDSGGVTRGSTSVAVRTL